MEYSRELCSIQGGLALRAGLLYLQYPNLVRKQSLPEDEQYDATLAVCVLQTLLTNCTELLKVVCDSNESQFLAPISEDDGDWLPPDSVKLHDIERTCTLKCALDHIRNALSHPTPARATGDYPVTGYTTLLDGSGRIGVFRFVDSPWVQGKEMGWRYSNRDRKTVKKWADDFARNNDWPDETFSVRQGKRGKYSVFLNDEPFLAVCTIELSVQDMGRLILSLATYLAQATKADSDWQTIVPLEALTVPAFT